MTPTEMNALNTWYPTLEGFMPTQHVCPVCGGDAYGTKRWNDGMVCYSCGAAWDSKPVIIPVVKYDPNNPYWDKRVMKYNSGWFEITNLYVSGS